jgi:hypothetical protein
LSIIRLAAGLPRRRRPVSSTLGVGMRAPQIIPKNLNCSRIGDYM